MRALGTLALGFAPSLASAGNQFEPRVVPNFGDVPCLITHDRLRDGLFHIAYSIDHEDTDLQADELSDSRRHQFFAFRLAYRSLPPWISSADVQRAIDMQITDAPSVSDEDVLELSSDWTPEDWLRITSDDERLPITLVQASRGVDWDTRDAPLGAYLVAGYTWEPSANLWTTRRGIVQIVDSTIPRGHGPAIYFGRLTGAIVHEGDGYQVTVCVDAEPGSTYRLAWAIDAPGPPTWHDSNSGRIDTETELTIDFEIPYGFPGRAHRLRLEVESPEGRVHAAISRDLLVVLATESPSDGGTNQTDDSRSVAKDGCSVATAGRNNEGPPAWILLLVPFVVPISRPRRRPRWASLPNFLS